MTSIREYVATGPRRRRRLAAGDPRPGRAARHLLGPASGHVHQRVQLRQPDHPERPVIVIAMGLVFVLLLGEIDLSAGYTAGVAGAMLGVVVHHGTTGRGGSACWSAWSPAPCIGLVHRRPRGPGRHPVVRRDAGRLPRPAGRRCSRSSARAARSRSRARPCWRSCQQPCRSGWAGPCSSCWCSATPR